MIRLLSIDTTSWWGTFALLEFEASAGQPRVVAELAVEVRDSHAAGMFSWIEQLLQQADWSRSCLDAFVALRGPGSFTGIRVGLGAIRGLSLAAGKPCVGVTTLEALAHDHGPADRDRLSLVGAGRGDLYSARYDPASLPPFELEPPSLQPIGRTLDRAGDAVLLCAPGSERTVAEPASDRQLGPIHTPRNLATSAGCLALLDGRIESAATTPLVALYLRPTDAELKQRGE